MPDRTDQTQSIDPTPTCSNCLHLMDAAGADQRPYWQCPHCGAIALSI